MHIWIVWNNALFIGLKISVKVYYRADTDNRTNEHLSADADISCIPS